MAFHSKKSSVARELRIVKALDLQPADWAKVHWREHVPSEKPPALPFDWEKTQAHLRQLAGDYHFICEWDKANLSISQTRSEAHFWLVAMVEMCNKSTGKRFLQQVDSQKFTGNLLFTDFYPQLLQRMMDEGSYSIIASRLSPEICLPLVNLLSREEFRSLLFGKNQPLMTDSKESAWRIERFTRIIQDNLVHGFQEYILPYQSHAEIQLLKQEIAQELEMQWWPGDHQKPSALFYLAAALGDRRLRELVESWPDNFYHQDQSKIYPHAPASIVMGLENAELIKMHMQRLQLPIKDIGSWLAHTEFSAIDYLGETILGNKDKTEREALLRKLLECAQAPELAPVMLKLTLAKVSGQIARKWLQNNPGNAIAGLIPIAAGSGALAETALEFLCSMQRQGHQIFIEQCLQQEPIEVAAAIRSQILAKTAEENVVFDDQTTPDWLRKALQLVQPLKKRGWAIDPCELPAISIGNRRLSDPQVSLLLDALEQSTLDAPHPLVAEFKARIDRSILDNFAWKLLEIWLGGGGPPPGKWALRAIGLIGADALAIKLAPLLRQWPKQGQHPRTALGLECLRAIGTNVALMEINDIAQNYKSSSLKNRAQACMEEIAKSRGITLEQLIDRIIPNYDLDDQGQRIFDFGPRRFQLLIDGDLNPIIQDAQGKQMNNLPRRNNKDNLEQADLAIADWKLMKKQISDALKIHCLRLESAMVQRRTWDWGEFEPLLIRHPLMTHLAQRLVWATFDDQGILQTTFRVAEDWTCIDQDEHHYSPDANATIEIVHPLWLNDATKFMWIEIMGENHIIQPFSQLNREVYHLTADEENQPEIKRFKDMPISCDFLNKMMKTYGWWGQIGDRGGYIFHRKYFKRAGITAMISGYDYMYAGQGPQAAMNSCLFMPGQFPNLVESPMSATNPSLRQQILKLGEVDRTIISEVLRDMSAIASGKS